MISKKLLEKVLKCKKIKFIDLEFDNTLVILYHTGVIDTTKINIYELAHKCKEWAYHTGHLLSVHMRGDLIKNTDKHFYVAKCGIARATTGYGDTEPEAIFKACEWILKQKEEQK